MGQKSKVQFGNDIEKWAHNNETFILTTIDNTLSINCEKSNSATSFLTQFKKRVPIWYMVHLDKQYDVLQHLSVAELNT